MKPREERRTFIERRTDKIVNARSLTLGLALTFIMLALVGAVIIWLVDRHDFPTLGSATWWSLQTVTTVGYGDVVPKTAVGRVIGGVELVIGVSFVAFLTAGVTSNVIQREGARAEEARNTEREEEASAIIAALKETRSAITALDSRLDAIESKLSV